VLAPASITARSEQPASIDVDAVDTPDIIAPSAASSLPDAPSAIASAHENTEEAPARHSTSSAAGIAPKYAHTIHPGQIAQPLTARDKFVYSIEDRASIGPFLDILWRAGFEQAVNGSPHYGTDSGAFGERLGAAAIKQTTSHILTNGVFAPLLHDDPRFYQLGDSYPVKRRLLYAGTRVIITRKDDGRPTINIPRLAATVSVAALNNLYYPPEDRGFQHSATNVATSLAIKAAGYEFGEFMGDLLHIVHRSKE